MPALMRQAQNLASDLLGQGQQDRTKGMTGFEKTLDTSDFFTSDVSVSSGKYNLLGYYTVGAQQLVELGQGTNKLEPMEQGRPFVKLQNSSPSVLDGFIKLTHESAQGTETQKIIEERTEAFNESTKSERIVMPRASTRGFSKVKEDSKIGFYFKPDSDGTVSQSDCTVRIPATVYE